MPVSNRNPTSGIDFGALARFEGNVCNGYVPSYTRPPRQGQPIGDSGVTIGMGIDLGCRCEADLLRLGLEPAVAAKLRPYLGKRREEAQEALAVRPLQLSEAEVQALNAAVAAETIGRLAARWDATVAWRPARMRFRSLPWQAQTVLASVAWQYGENLPRAAPRFWALATSLDWPAVIRELENFGDAYSTRRRREASLLRTMAGCAGS